MVCDGLEWYLDDCGATYLLFEQWILENVCLTI